MITRPRTPSYIETEADSSASRPGILVAVMMRKKIVSLLGTFGEINLNTVSNVQYHSVSKAEGLQDPVLFFVDTEIRAPLTKLDSSL